MDEIKCKICDRSFGDSKGLEQHNLSKHQASKSIPKKSKNIKLIVIISLIGLLILSGFGWALNSYVAKQGDCKTMPVEEINIGDHSNAASHYHANLEIIIDGDKQPIPSNIGVDYNLMRPVHTHDSIGELHIEGPCERDFTLGDFFTIWGKEFNSERIFDKTTENGELVMTINGKENFDFEKYILKDDVEIVIEYKEN